MRGLTNTLYYYYYYIILYKYSNNYIFSSLNVQFYFVWLFHHGCYELLLQGSTPEQVAGSSPGCDE